MSPPVCRAWSCAPVADPAAIARTNSSGFAHGGAGFFMAQSDHVHRSAATFPSCQISGPGGALTADPIMGRAPHEEAAMGQDLRSPRGPQGNAAKCIALVGPFQSGKTTLLEA